VPPGLLSAGYVCEGSRPVINGRGSHGERVAQEPLVRPWRRAVRDPHRRRTLKSRSGRLTSRRGGSDEPGGLSCTEKRASSSRTSWWSRSRTGPVTSISRSSRAGYSRARPSHHEGRQLWLILNVGGGRQTTSHRDPHDATRPRSYQRFLTSVSRTSEGLRGMVGQGASSSRSRRITGARSVRISGTRMTSH